MFRASAAARAEALAVPILYGLYEAALIGLYCTWAWKAGWTKAPPSDTLARVVCQSYQDGRRHHHHDCGDDDDEDAERCGHDHNACVVDDFDGDDEDDDDHVVDDEDHAGDEKAAVEVRWTTGSLQGYSPVKVEVSVSTAVAEEDDDNNINTLPSSTLMMFHKPNGWADDEMMDKVKTDDSLA